MNFEEGCYLHASWHILQRRDIKLICEHNFSYKNCKKNLETYSCTCYLLAYRKSSFVTSNMLLVHQGMHVEFTMPVQPDYLPETS